MAMCVVLHAPVAMRIDLDRPCFPSARGRYLYVVLAREAPGKASLMITEIEAHSGELCHIQAFTNHNHSSRDKTLYFVISLSLETTILKMKMDHIFHRIYRFVVLSFIIFGYIYIAIYMYTYSDYQYAYK